MYYDFTMREKRMGRSMFGNASFWVRFTSLYFAANSTHTHTDKVYNITTRAFVSYQRFFPSLAYVFTPHMGTEVQLAFDIVTVYLSWVLIECVESDTKSYDLCEIPPELEIRCRDSASPGTTQDTTYLEGDRSVGEQPSLWRPHVCSTFRYNG